MSVHVRMARRVPDLVLKLQQLARPTFVEGRWRKSKISPRKLATIRKSLVAEGVWWPPRPLRNRGADKPLKLKKWERQKEERQALTLLLANPRVFLFSALLKMQSTTCHIDNSMDISYYNNS